MKNFHPTDLPLSHLLVDDDYNRIKTTLKEVQLPKGDTLMNQKEGITKAYLIKKGIIRSFVHKGEKEITFEFAREKDIVSSGYGYYFAQKGYEKYQLLEDCILYEIDLDKMKKLYADHISICNWARSITEYNAIRTQKRLTDLLFMTPEERYTDLLVHDKELLQRVPLKDIAGFIGISPISLSRIRARITPESLQQEYQYDSDPKV